MIYDVGCIPWWRFTIPLDSAGKPERRHYKHRAHGWYVVRDGLRKPRVYYEDRVRKVRRITPPHFEKDVETQTDFTTADAEVQTRQSQNDGTDMWDYLRECTAGLPVEMKVIVYDRLERFLDMGLLFLRAPQNPRCGRSTFEGTSSPCSFVGCGNILL